MRLPIYFLCALAFWLTTGAAFATEVRQIPLTVVAHGAHSQIAHIRINLRPTFTFIPNNEAYSDFSTQVVIVRDARTGDVVSAFRQNDANFVNQTLYLPGRYLDANGRFTLTLTGSSSWAQGERGQAPVEVTSVEPAGFANYFQSFEIVFGKPDDVPFVRDNMSYAEGAYRMAGTWFFNKFFRYADDPASFALPLARGSTGLVTLNFYLSARASLRLNGSELAIFDRSLGNRFFQDYYSARYTFNSDQPAVMQVANVSPFRATPTNLRQMAFAFNSVSIATAVAQRPAIDLRGLLNTRLDYRQRGSLLDELRTPANSVDALLQYQGAAWLPGRAPISHDAFARHIDAIVLLDPVLNDIAAVSHSTGDVWMDSAVGAAMLLEGMGYSTAYAFPEDIARLNPKIIYVPSQPFYGSALSRQTIQAMLSSDASIIIEPSFSADFLGNQAFQQSFGFQFAENADFIVRDDVTIQGRAPTDAFAITPVFRHELHNAGYVPRALLTEHQLHTAYSADIGGNHVLVLTFPAAYYFFNYGLRSHRDVVRAFIAEQAPPLVRAVSRSQVRAYVVGQDRCRADIMAENNNFGAFNYYGFAQVNAALPSATPPVASDITLSGALFTREHEWRPMRRNRPPLVDVDSTGAVHVRNLTEDAVITLVDRRC